jgi:hypothetical protein
MRRDLWTLVAARRGLQPVRQPYNFIETIACI